MATGKSKTTMGLQGATGEGGLGGGGCEKRMDKTVNFFLALQ